MILGLALSSTLCAQEGLTDGQQKKTPLVAGTNLPKKNMVTRNVVPYPETDEADIVWQRRIRRAVELTEKLNHPLYFPTIETPTSKSFIQSVLEGIEKGQITAYNDDYTDTLTLSGISEKLGAISGTRVVEKLDGSGDTIIYVKGTINWSEVKELIITEEWFFDKRYSQMFVRIVGICPVRVFQRTISTADGDEEQVGDYSKRELFWIYYPDARKYLAKTICYATANEAAPLSYDDLFLRRKFSSRITSVGTTMNNRHVEEYSRSGLESMLESRRLETEIMNLEHDLWEY